MSRGTRATARRRHLGQWIAAGIGLAGILALILVIQPEQLAAAFARFDPVLIPLIVAGSLLYYVLQGIRWHLLLRDVGSTLTLGHSVTLNLVGQTTTLLPLGELTRVALASRAAKMPFSDALATVTVQELIYGLLLVVVAVPGLFEFHLNPAIPLVAVAVALLAMAVLLFPPFFHGLHRLLERILGVRRLVGPLEELRAETVGLLQRPDTLAWSVIGLAQVAAMTTVFWLVVDSVSPGVLTWPEAASVYAVASIGGAISMIPGGLGASEATFAGVLIVAGFSPATATAIALIQRVADEGVAMTSGFVAYGLARRRYDLSGLFR